jgi:hypothetical protein
VLYNYRAMNVPWSGISGTLFVRRIQSYRSRVRLVESSLCVEQLWHLLAGQFKSKPSKLSLVLTALPYALFAFLRFHATLESTVIAFFDIAFWRHVQELAPL